MPDGGSSNMRELQIDTEPQEPPSLTGSSFLIW
jgi:hypothetical protein